MKGQAIIDGRMQIAPGTALGSCLPEGAELGGENMGGRAKEAAKRTEVKNAPRSVVPAMEMLCDE
jgi:hypothetical protein